MRRKQLQQFTSVLIGLVLIVILATALLSRTYTYYYLSIFRLTGGQHGPGISKTTGHTFTSSEFQLSSRQRTKHNEPSKFEKLQKLNEISKKLQKDLYALQNSKSCDGLVTLNCSALYKGCGFGCHIHSKISCLMLPWVMGVPWIKGHYTGWKYRESWSKYLKPAWSKCPVSNMTIPWYGQRTNESVQQQSRFKQGLPVPYSLGLEVAKNHDFPFLWMVGQFAKFAFRLKSEALEKIDEFKRNLGIVNGEPLAGIHVRRTDKITHEESLFISEYAFIQALQEYRNKSGIRGKLKVFITSETNEVLAEFRKQYESAELTFVGDADLTGEKMSDRVTKLFTVLRDIKLLSECDFVVCTLSSNVGRLVLEPKSQQEVNISQSLESLDKEFFYYSSVHVLPTKLVLTGLPANSSVIYSRNSTLPIIDARVGFVRM